MASGGIGGTRSAGRVDRVVVAIALVLGAVLLAGCGGDGGVERSAAAAGAAPPTTSASTTVDRSAEPPSTTVAAADPVATGRLRVTQHQTACCFPTGRVSWVIVRDDEGREVVQRRFRAVTDVFPVLDERLAPGRYRLVAAQQPCAANCSRLGDAVDQCSTEVEVTPGVDGFLTVGVAPGAACLFVATPGPQSSTVPDEVALPGAATDCGLDQSLADAAATGADVDQSPARRCLAAAYERGSSAWVMADEPSDLPGAVDVVVYRTNGDGTVDAYRVVEPLVWPWTWERSRCTALVPDAVRSFLLQGCGPAEPVPIA